MKKQTTRILVLIVSLCMLATSVACTPSPEPDANAPADTMEINVYVDSIELLIMESFPVQVTAIVRGNLPDGCAVLDGISATRSGKVFTLEIAAHREGEACTQALVPFEENVALDVEGLEAGTYQVVAGDVSAEFTLDVDNSPVDGTSVGYARDLRGTVTGIEQGADGIQVELVSGDTEYSVTISILQVEMFGRFDQIQEQSEIEVSGPIIPGMEPVLVVAEKVTVLGSEPDYVLNLRGTVTGIEPGTDGITAEIETYDGTIYHATISLVTTELVYTGVEEEIQVGTPVLISGELFDLDGPTIAANTVVVYPGP